MNLRKGVAGITAAAMISASLAAGLAFADETYQPTTLGNSDYTNYTDLRNDIYVDGMNYVGSIGQENSDTLAAAAELSNQFGTQGGEAYALTVENKLDQAITKLEVKDDDTNTYKDLGLSSKIAAGDSACWWYTQEYKERSVTNQSGKTYLTPVTYTFRATLADGTTAEFHNVNMKGVQTLAFRYSDDYKVNYVERTTVTNHTPDPNLLYEYNLSQGKADDTETIYTADEFNYHVNSAVRMGDRQITASRGGGWEVSVPQWSDVNYAPDFGVYVQLYGEPSKAYTNGTYAHLYWNMDLIRWRVTNGDAGDWGENKAVSGAGEYGSSNPTANVDYHPGCAEGDWTYTDGE